MSCAENQMSISMWDTFERLTSVRIQQQKEWFLIGLVDDDRVPELFGELVIRFRDKPETENPWVLVKQFQIME